MIDELIALLMPFIFAALVQFMGKGVEIYARRTMKTTLPDEVRGSVSPKVEEFAIELSSQIYIQLGFVFGVLSSSISCIAYTIRSQRPIFAAVGAAALVSLITYWVIFWQGLSAKELQGDKGKAMRRWKWATIVILCAITIYARFSPATGQSN